MQCKVLNIERIIVAKATPEEIAHLRKQGFISEGNNYYLEDIFEKTTEIFQSEDYDNAYKELYLCE